MKISIALLALATVLAGCSTTSGLSPVVSRSGFDNARVVDIVPHGNNNPDGWPMTGLGAQWTSAHPDEVILLVMVYRYTGITGAELNIDGQRLTLQRTPQVSDLENMSGVQTSTRAFVTSLATVEKIVNSKRTWLRVYTPTGTIEDAVIDGSTDSKAYNALKRFLASVKAQ